MNEITYPFDSNKLTYLQKRWFLWNLPAKKLCAIIDVVVYVSANWVATICNPCTFLKRLVSMEMTHSGMFGESINDSLSLTNVFSLSGSRQGQDSPFAAVCVLCALHCVLVVWIVVAAPAWRQFHTSDITSARRIYTIGTSWDSQNRTSGHPREKGKR